MKHRSGTQRKFKHTRGQGISQRCKCVCVRRSKCRCRLWVRRASARAARASSRLTAAIGPHVFLDARAGNGSSISAQVHRHRALCVHFRFEPAPNSNKTHMQNEEQYKPELTLTIPNQFCSADCAHFLVKYLRFGFESAFSD